MIRYLTCISLAFSLVACSTFSGQSTSSSRLGQIENKPVRVLPNEPIDVTHEQVQERYLRFLAVSKDSEMRIRVTHRMAALKLQAEELALDNASENVELSEGRRKLAVINDYENLLTEHPKRPDNDALLYQLAKAYSLSGQQFSAIATLERLTESFPNSQYLLESHFRLGQLYYSSRDYEMAGLAYQNVIDIGRQDNEYYVSAGYLLGWSLFKENRYEDSLLAFTRVLDEEFTNEDELENTEVDADLRDDIFRIMATTFAEMGDWEQVALFYETHGTRFYEYRLYESLASLYYSREFHRSAASTLRAFVLRYPLDKRSPEYYERLIEGYKKARYAGLMRRHMENYVDLFGVETEYWQQQSAMQPKLTASLSAYMWDLASFHHGWGQNTKNAKDKAERLNIAARWYNEYVNSFPQADDAVKAHFLLAEVSFELKDYRTARHQYEIVAYQYPEYEQANEAGYAAILAYNNYRPSAEESKEWRQATVASAMRFVQEYSADPRSGTVLVNTSEMLLKDKYYEQALYTARLAANIEDQLSPRYRYGAALVRSHASFKLGYYEEAENAITLALAQQQADVKTRKDLRDKLAASIYRLGEQSKEQGDAEAAVYHWLRLASVVPESNTKVLAQYDAATLLMETADYPQAIEVLTDFREKYPQHKLTVDISSKLIVAYEAQENWQAAAFELKRMAQTSNNTEEQRIATFQAAEYFEKAKDLDNARDMYRNYAHDYAKPFDAAVEAHYRLDQIYAQLGEEDKRHFWLDKIISLHNKAGNEQSDRSRYLAASAAFQLGEFERQRFEKVAITLPLDRSITTKNNYLQAAQKRYTQAAQLNVQEFTTASTFHLGQLYADMSLALVHSERPKGLDELELEEYEFIIEEQVFPLEEAAIEIHQTNSGRTRDGLYDRWIKHSFASLAKLMPGQYNRQERVITYVDQIR